MCNARYATRFGVLVEMVMDTESFGFPPACESEPEMEFSPGFTTKKHLGLCCLAPLPPSRMQGVKAGYIEKASPKCRPP